MMNAVEEYSDLYYAITYAIGDRLMTNEVTKVVKEITGENDGNPWHWLLKLTKGWAYVEAHCDYTGWD